MGSHRPFSSSSALRRCSVVVGVVGVLAVVPVSAFAAAVPGILAKGPLNPQPGDILAGGLHRAGTASFGPPLPFPALKGEMAIADDGVGTTDDACESLANAAAMNGRFALIQRGSCGFVQKVKNAQDAGAIAAVIYDDVRAPDPPLMGGADPTIVIPAASATFDGGLFYKSDIRQLALRGEPNRYEVGLFDVTGPVFDATPPDVVARATGPSGGVVSFTLSATDDLDPAPVISCTHPSGSTFPIGDTFVICSATDAAGNSEHSAGFNVHVKGPGEQIDDLIDKVVDRLRLSPTVAAQLRAQLKSAAAAMLARDTQRACNGLKNFKLAVQLAARARVISTPDAADLTGDADRIRAVLAC